MKTKFTMSLVMMIGSVLLFVGVTFAWIIVNRTIDSEDITSIIADVSVLTTLESSLDGVEYNSTEILGVSNIIPGDVVFYRLTIENTGNTSIDLRVRFFGFTSNVSNPLKNNLNHIEGRSLINVVKLSVTNTKNSDQINEQILSNVIGTLPVGLTYSQANLNLINNIFLPVGDILSIDISFSLPTNIGNDYQNLRLSISSIIIDAVIN